MKPLRSIHSEAVPVAERWWLDTFTFPPGKARKVLRSMADAGVPALLRHGARRCAYTAEVGTSLIRVHVLTLGPTLSAEARRDLARVLPTATHRRTATKLDVGRDWALCSFGGGFYTARGEPQGHR